MFQRIGLDSALELKRRMLSNPAGCRKPDDVARMNSMGFTGVLIDPTPESVDRAADEVIAPTDNRLYGILTMPVTAAVFPPSAVSRWSNSFPVNFFGAHQLTMRLLPAMLPLRRRTHCDDSSVMGLISTSGRGAYAASKYALEARV